VLDGSITKEGRPDERRVLTFLAPFVDSYVKNHRPILAAKAQPSSAFWLTRSGLSLTECAVRETIQETVYSRDRHQGLAAHVPRRRGIERSRVVAQNAGVGRRARSSI
jgi:hypothetical protein